MQPCNDPSIPGAPPAIFGRKKWLFSLCGIALLLLSLLTLSLADTQNQAEAAPLGQGTAYVFLRPFGPANQLGHVGWAFQTEAGKYIYGSTSGPGNAPAQDICPLGSKPKINNNGWWCKETTRISTMLADMRSQGYIAYKLIKVNKPDIEAAKRAAMSTRQAGYKLFGNNCADHARQIFSSYGVKNMPFLSSSSNINPLWWFDHLTMRDGWSARMSL